MPMPDGETTHGKNSEDHENDEECAKTELKGASFILQVFDRHRQVAALRTRSLCAIGFVGFRFEVEFAVFATKLEHRRLDGVIYRRDQ